MDGPQSSRDRVKFFYLFDKVKIHRKKNEPDLYSCVSSTEIVGLNRGSCDREVCLSTVIIFTQVCNFDEVFGSWDLFLKLTHIIDFFGTYSHAFSHFVFNILPGKLPIYLHFGGLDSLRAHNNLTPVFLHWSFKGLIFGCHELAHSGLDLANLVVQRSVITVVKDEL